MLTSAVISLQPLNSSDTQPEARVVSEWVINEVFKGKIPIDSEFYPYTISGVLHAPQIGFYLRITTLTALASEVLQVGLKCLPEQLTFNQSMFQIRAVTVDGATHPAAGNTTYPRLAMTSLKRRNPHQSVDWMARFLTPTRLIDDLGLPTLLPEPIALYLDLQKRWEYFTETQLLSLHDFVGRCIEISYANLRTGSVKNDHETTLQQGFVGGVRYRLKPMGAVDRGLHKDWQHYLHMLRMLTQFAFYAGIGQGGEIGMGQFRCKAQL